MVQQKIYLYLLVLSCFIFVMFNLTDCLSDSEFVTLIKDMAIKNHNDPSLFKKVYTEAATIELKQQKYLTNQFYECVYHYQHRIQTKADINNLCGQFLTFK